MKPGMHTWSFRNRFKEDPTFTIFDCLDMTADMGFTSIEIMSGKANCPPDHIGPDDPTHLDKVMAHAATRGIEVVCLSTYNDFAYVMDEEWRLANVAYIKHWLGIAGRLGVPNIRMLTGYYNDKAPRAELERLTREGIRECIPYAEQAGVNMAIENHTSIFFEADEIMALIDAMGSARLTTCPDPSNWGRKAFFEGDPQAKQTVLDGARIVAPRATQSHLKVRGIAPDGTIPGFGNDLVELVRIYATAGYDGPLAFESVGDGDLLEPLVQAREIVEKAIAEVKQG